MVDTSHTHVLIFAYLIRQNKSRLSLLDDWTIKIEFRTNEITKELPVGQSRDFKASTYIYICMYILDRLIDIRAVSFPWLRHTDQK
jgi:hypothetical protein